MLRSSAHKKNQHPSPVPVALKVDEEARKAFCSVGRERQIIRICRGPMASSAFDAVCTWVVSILRVGTAETRELIEPSVDLMEYNHCNLSPLTFLSRSWTCQNSYYESKAPIQWTSADFVKRRTMDE